MTLPIIELNAVQDEKRRLRIAGVSVGISMFATLGLVAPFVFTRSPLPFMATPPRKLFRALEQALRYPTIKNKVFVDLGSGDGEAVYQALKVGYHRAIGIELNFTMYLLSSCRRWIFWPREYRQRSRFCHQNMFHSNFHGAGTVMIFGVKSLEPGTLVLSYRFTLPKAHSEGDSQLLRANLISDEEEMKVYEVIARKE